MKLFVIGGMGKKYNIKLSIWSHL